MEKYSPRAKSPKPKVTQTAIYQNLKLISLAIVSLVLALCSSYCWPQNNEIKQLPCYTKLIYFTHFWLMSNKVIIVIVQSQLHTAVLKRKIQSQMTIIISLLRLSSVTIHDSITFSKDSNDKNRHEPILGI